jgi:hypothetical protein
MSDVCEHGSLARKCERCEVVRLDARVFDLEGCLKDAARAMAIAIDMIASEYCSHDVPCSPDVPGCYVNEHMSVLARARKALGGEP